jgi:hypothetical protein
MQKIQEPRVDQAAISARAYELFVARGRTPGHDVEDWLQAERELRRAATVVKAVAEIPLFPPTVEDEAPKPTRRRRQRKA